MTIAPRINRRQATLALAGAVALPAWARFSDQPIKLLVGFPPGGGGDLYGRLIAGALSPGAHWNWRTVPDAPSADRTWRGFVSGVDPT